MTMIIIMTPTMMTTMMAISPRKMMKTKNTSWLVETTNNLCPFYHFLRSHFQKVNAKKNPLKILYTETFLFNRQVIFFDKLLDSQRDILYLTRASREQKKLYFCHLTMKVSIISSLINPLHNRIWLNIPKFSPECEGFNLNLHTYFEIQISNGNSESEI